MDVLSINIFWAPKSSTPCLPSILPSHRSSDNNRSAFRALKDFALSSGSRLNIESRAQGAINSAKKTLTGRLQLPFGCVDKDSTPCCFVEYMYLSQSLSLRLFWKYLFFLSVCRDAWLCGVRATAGESEPEPDRANGIMVDVTDESFLGAEGTKTAAL